MMESIFDSFAAKELFSATMSHQVNWIEHYLP